MRAGSTRPLVIDQRERDEAAAQGGHASPAPSGFVAPAAAL